MAQFKKTVGALFCLLCLVVPFTSGESVVFENCSTTEPLVNVTGVDVSPFPFRIGQFNVTISAFKFKDAKIDGGVLEIFFNVGGDFTHLPDRNLCETTSCPITDGAFTISNTLDISEVLRGQNQYRIEAMDTEVRTFICISFTIEVDS